MKRAADLRLINPPAQSVRPPPLVVDLDGTLVRTDLLLESLLALVKQRPHIVFRLAVWLLKGKAYFKQQIARRVSLDVKVLPFRDDVLDYVKTQRALGRMIVLATAEDLHTARQVADHLRLFDLVIASDGATNLSGEAKRNRLLKEFGERGFDYAADHPQDLLVWAAARKAIVVNPSRGLRAGAAEVAQVEKIFEDRKRILPDYLEPLRPRHWMKNLLVFVPLLMAHRDGPLLAQALLAFLAFGCVSSSGYLINDLFDLQADRHHPEKRLRPFAAGNLPLSYGLAMFPAMVGLGCLIGLLVSPLFLGMLWIYLTLALTYSLYLKKVALLDVIVLAGLYTIRILAGSAAVAIWPSHWLLAFSTFLFLSLALVKRYGELVIMRTLEGDAAKARGYELSDGELLAAMGTASGYLAVLVLALYISSDNAHDLYRRYEFMWFLCPLLLYWISHVWLTAHRGRMPDDPVSFATSDRTSRILILLMLAATVLAL